MIFMLLISIIVSFAQLSGQTTYTWIGADNAAWNVGSNWSPARNTPLNTDILQFNSGTARNVTAVPTQSIGKLRVTANTTVSLKPLTGSNKTLTIRTPSADAILVEAGSVLTIMGLDAATDYRLTLTTANTAGIEANIFGVLRVAKDNLQDAAYGLFTKGLSATINFHGGSTYEHAINGSGIPVATWDIASNCNITGSTANPPTGATLGQAFGNFTWNCAGQTANISLGGNLINVRGTFTLANTGTFFIRPAGSATYGNFLQTGGNYRLATVAGTPYTLTIPGNFTMEGGLFVMSNANVTGTVTVAGNFSHTAGSISETGTGSGAIVFNGAGVQTYTSGGTVNNTIAFTVNSGSTLQMADAGTQLTGGGSFTLSGTLGITSQYGITSTGTVTNPGNIAVTGTRTFNTSANYIYNGDANQAAGSGLPAAVNSLTVSNTGGLGGNTVTLSQNTTVTTNLTVTMGTLDLSLYTCDCASSGSTLNVADGAILKIGGTNTMPSGYSIHSLGAASTIEYSGDAQTVSPETYGNLAASGSGMKTIAAGSYVTVNNNLSTGNLLTIESTSTTNSGSLIVRGTSTGTVTYNRVMPGSLYRYISSPVNSPSLPSGTYWYWNEQIGDWSSTSSCSSGLGYTMAATGGTVSFTGTVVTSASQTGTAPYNSSETYTNDRGNWGGGGWNLLGNPFTSAMSATAFISANSASLDPSYLAVYIYNGSDYYYVASSVPGYPGQGTFSSTDIQAGQGFFVIANYNGVPFSFTSAMQEHNSSAPMTKSAKAEDPWPGLQLKVRFGNTEKSTLAVYNDKMTPGLDPGYDVGLYSAGSDIEIYTKLIKDKSADFARQALPVEDYDKNIIPVGVNCANGGEVTFSAYVVPLGNYKFYLEDRLTGTFTDLNSKSYTVTLPAKTLGTGRFYIYASVHVPKNNKPVTEDPGHLGLKVWTSGHQVNINGEVSSKAKCEVYDFQGHKILEFRLSEGSYNTFTVPSSVRGVCLLKVSDGSKKFVQKVIL